MKAKRMLSLVMAAVLALCVLAGCRGGRALSQVMAGLLEGQYQNVAVEADPDLEAALRAAVREGVELADILARLQQELGLGGGTLTLRGLSGGRQGEHAVELRFEPGSDPDTAARKAFADWDAALARLPSDGQYAAEIAMVEAEGGYYIAVDVKIVKAGKPDTDDDDEEVGDNYTVNTSDGLAALFENEEENKDYFKGKTITLQAGETYIVKEQLASTFKGTLTSDAGNKATIEITGGSSLFGTIGEIILDEDDALDYIDKTGTVQNLQIKVTDSIIVGDGAQHNESANAGAVAGENYNSISGCTVTIESGGSISASGKYARAGGVVGGNSEGTISRCTVTIESTGSISATGNSNPYAGGVAGDNSRNCTIESCKVTVSGEISDSISATTGTGGVVGNNNGGMNDNYTVKPNGEIIEQG